MEAGTLTEHLAAMMTPFSDSTPKRRRRGSTMTGLLAALGIVGTFATVVYVLVPTGVYGGASSAGAEPVQARHESNQLLIESLAALIGHSVEVIAVHPRTASPYKEIVLRLQDSQEIDGVPAEDIAVISHSSVLHTIMFYTLEPEKSATKQSGDSWMFARDELAHPGFCDRWRSNPYVKPRLIARSISDMQVKSIDQANAHGPALRLSLTWSPDSADGGDTAAVLINAVINSPPPRIQ